MDGSWNDVADAFMAPKLGDQLDELDSLFSRFNLPPGGQYDGWYQYFDRDIRELLGKKVSRRSRPTTAATASSRPARTRSGARSPPRARRSDRAGHVRPVAVALGREPRADHLRAGAVHGDDALHEPPDRDPAGDLVRRPPLAPSGGRHARLGQQDDEQDDDEQRPDADVHVSSSFRAVSCGLDAITYPAPGPLIPRFHAGEGGPARVSQKLSCSSRARLRMSGA